MGDLRYQLKGNVGRGMHYGIMMVDMKYLSVNNTLFNNFAFEEDIADIPQFHSDMVDLNGIDANRLFHYQLTEVFANYPEHFEFFSCYFGLMVGSRIIIPGFFQPEHHLFQIEEVFFSK
jgi:hypothetical protein